jgi:hypothetical protein
VWKDLRRYQPVLLLVIVATFFLIGNRGAYKGYFGDDEFDNLALTRAIGPGEAVAGLLSPRYYENNFRPVGHVFYRVLARIAGLRFPPYIAALHFLHLVNVALLWLILRRLGLPFWALAVALVFFGFHMAVFDVYWRPEYVYDLLCGTFCLLALLVWLHDQWILSLLFLWLAYRSKEIAVMFPVALAAYELLLGKRRWLRLAPSFAISLWFGVQGLLVATHLQSAYSMHYQPADLAKSLLFYASRIFLWPSMGGLLLLAVPILVALLTRDGILSFGLITFVALLTPMLLLSERLSGAYLYVPLIGFAVAVGAMAARPRAALAVAAALLLWIPWNYVDLRRLRREALSQVDDRRRYVATLADLVHSNPQLRSFLYFDGPFLESGALGAIRWLQPGVEILVAREDGPDRSKIIEQSELAVLYWNRTDHRLEPVLRTPATPDATYLQIGSHLPVWQLGDGWFPNEGAFRWTRPRATARLLRPANAAEFELTVNIGQQYLERIHRSHVEVLVNDQKIGATDFDRLGYQTVRWKLAPAPAGSTEVTFETSPPYTAADPLGSAIVAFGFLPKP